jgi:nucleotide-binding universal stress UspA family protein
LAHDEYYDLLIVPTHGESGKSQTFLGHLAGRIVQQATTPVLIVRPQKGAKGEFITDSVKLGIDNLVVGIDYGRGGDRALKSARELARSFGSAITLVHALELPHTQIGLLFNGENRKRVLEEAMIQLREFRDKNLPESADWKTVVQIGTACTVLEACAKDVAGTVVVGPRTPGRWVHSILGTTGQRLAHTASSPVMVVK